jgi:hypothetical protein
MCRGRLLRLAVLTYPAELGEFDFDPPTPGPGAAATVVERAAGDADS